MTKDLEERYRTAYPTKRAQRKKCCQTMVGVGLFIFTVVALLLPFFV